MTYPGEVSRTAKTTSSGIAYTEVALTIGADAALLALPANPTGTLLLTAHGHNNTEQVLAQAVFAGTLDAAIGARWPVLASNAAGNSWGSDAGIAAEVAAWTWARTNLGTTRTVLHGQSMGALVLANVLSRGLITDQVCFISIDGALNLAKAYETASYATAIRAAYGMAADGSDYATKTAGHDACLLPAGTFNGTRILLEASTGDTAIPKANHADVFATAIAGHPRLLSRITGTGAHVAAENYMPTAVRSFAAAAVLGALLPMGSRTIIGLRSGGTARVAAAVRPAA